MTERIIMIFEGLVRNRYLLVTVLSVLPVTEIKGAILYAAVAEVPMFPAFLCGFAATIGLSAFLCFFCPRLLHSAERSSKIKSVTTFLTDRLQGKAEKILSSDGEGEVGKKRFGVFAFVALPLPLTGVFAGALLAALLRLDYKNSLLALIAGNFTAGGIVLFVALVSGVYAEIVLDAFMLLAVGALLFAAGKSLVAKKKARSAKNESRNA